MKKFETIIKFSPDFIPIEMVWNDLKFHLTNNCSIKTQGQLIFHINTRWKSQKDDLVYCNKKFDHLPKVIDRIIASCGLATGL